MAALDEVQKHNSKVLETFEKGDLVEFPRGIYSHWAVFVGDGKVIHLTGDENDENDVSSGYDFTISGTRFSKAVVKRDDFWDVTCGCKAYKNNGKDKKMSPSEAKEIVQRALEKLGEIGYNVLWNNCEHFASFCRYGKSKSDQVDTVFKFTAAAAAAVVGGVVYALGRSSKRRKTEKHTDK